MALIRDGNGTRSFETLLRYRGAAMAEFWRALKTLKALQAEARAAAAAAAEVPERHAAPPALVRTQAPRPAARPKDAQRRGPNEPARRPDAGPVRGLEYVPPDPPASGRTMHEPAAPWTPNEPETGRAPHAPSGAVSRTPTRSPTLAPPTPCHASGTRRCSARSHGRCPELTPEAI
jgi:hypothetical protein